MDDLVRNPSKPFTPETRAWWWRFTGKREPLSEMEQRLTGIDRDGLLAEYLDQMAEYRLRLLVSIASLSVILWLYADIVPWCDDALRESGAGVRLQYTFEFIALCVVMVSMIHFLILFWFSLRQVLHVRDLADDLIQRTQHR